MLSHTHFKEEKTEALKGRSHLPTASQHVHVEQKLRTVSA